MKTSPLLLLIAFAIPGGEPVASPPEALRFQMLEAMEQVRSDESGSRYTHGGLYDFDPRHLGVVVTLVDGTVVEAGDTQVGIPLMSVSKPFAYAAAVERHGPTYMSGRIGLNATGLPFDAVKAPERNPLVNLGAIAAHSYLYGFDTVAFFSRLAGAQLKINPEWQVKPTSATMATAYVLSDDGALDGDPTVAAQRYLDACVVQVTPVQIARMGAVLASGGLAPGSEERLLQHETVRQVLSVMATAGMYEDSGEWLADVGMPSKSGVSGAVLSVVPGWGALVAYSPRLDEAGNSVRASKIIDILADKWGLHFVDRGFH